MVILGLACSVYAAEETESPSTATVLANVQAKYAGIERIKAEFRQVTFNATMNREQVASGVYYAEKPGRVRWDYEKPEAQHLLISGGKVEFYVPSDKQLMVSEAGQVEELRAVLDLLGGKGNVLERFKARLVDDAATSKDSGRLTIRLVPRKPMGNLLKVDFVIDDKTSLVQESLYWDIYGNRTQVSFSQIETPKQFKSSLFKLDVPRDVIVIDSAGNPIHDYGASREAASQETPKAPGM